MCLRIVVMPPACSLNRKTEAGPLPVSDLWSCAWTSAIRQCPTECDGPTAMQGLL